VAFDEAPSGGLVHWYAGMNLTAVLNMETSLSGSATPEHVEGAAEAAEAETGAADGLGVPDASLVLSTDTVLMRVVNVLDALHGEVVSAHYITK
jgi:hypothetical protein